MDVNTSGSGLSSGAITFFFSDLENSAHLWEHYPDAMPGVLARSAALLRAVLTAHHGDIFKTYNETFCVAFTNVLDAVAAAVAAQQALEAEVWDGLGPIRMRMAVHSGVADARDNDYFGPSLNRVARILSAGNGGQILLSAATHELVREALPPGLALRDLGEHPLKGLTHFEHIYQIVAPGLAADFPPLNTRENHPTNLPTLPTPSIGRDREIVAVGDMLARPAVRIITLVGPAGTGKTRLGLEVAASATDSYPHGVFFVALAAIRDPDLVIAAIAQTLGLRESKVLPLLDDVKAWLRDKKILLLLDNFEQVMAAATLVAELVGAAPGLKVLVTSRTTLHVYGEYEYAVQPLGLPDLAHLPPPALLAENAAVALFIARAQAVQPAFRLTATNAAAVAEICTRLDGLPLAIELAAARSKLLNPQALAMRLNKRLTLLNSGPRNLPERQQTLHNALMWSYDLLDPNEQRLFTRLGVFVGGWSLDAAEAVCNADGMVSDVLDGLASLMDKSFVRQPDADAPEPRFGMLETLREFALERLDARGEAAAIYQRHTAYCLGRVEEAETGLMNADAETAARLATDHDNIRAALAGALERQDGAMAARFGSILWRFWYAKGYIAEGRRLLDAAVAALTETVAVPLQVRLLSGGGVMAWAQGDSSRAATLLDRCLALCRTLDDTATLARVLNNRALVAVDQADFGQARRSFAESLAIQRTTGDIWAQAQVLNNLGEALVREGKDFAAARLQHEESLRLREELGDEMGIVMSLTNLGDLYAIEGMYTEALMLLTRSLGILTTTDDPQALFECLEALAMVAGEQAQPQTATRLFGAAALIRDTLGLPLSASERPRYERATRHVRAALGEAAFAAAWAEGQALSPAAVVAEAGRVHALERRAVAPPTDLSEREIEVLRLLAADLTYREIADKLIISYHTVNAHVRTIYSKLGVSSRTKAVRAAQERGLV